MNIKELIKLNIANPNWKRQKKRIEKHTNKTIFLIGGPAHGNLGDHAIIEEEKNFVQSFFNDYDCEEILMPFYHTQKRLLENKIKRNDVVAISGGGWMGNLWLHNELVVREVVNTYKNNVVIIFPQTVYYSENEEGKRVLDGTIQIINDHKNLLFCLRDKNSYDFVCKNFCFTGGSKAIYVPDMVLYGSLRTPSHKIENKINICLRDDCESITGFSYDTISKLIPNEYIACKVETVVPRRISQNKRISELQDCWKQFSSAKLTITDRLHAMLFSYLNGTPCIAMDNKTGKVFGVEKWIDESNMIFCVSNLTELSDAIDAALNRKIKPKRFDLSKNFAYLADEIRERIENYGY